MPLILDGRACAEVVRAEVAARAVELRRRGVVPALRILFAGDDPASQVYVRNKEGIDTQVKRMPAPVTFEELRITIEAWNRDTGVHGIVVQLPLPAGLDGGMVLSLVSPAKDVDGLTPASLGALVAGRPGFTPATPSGIVELLARNGITISGRRVAIVGRGELVGKPLANMLLLHGPRADATVTVCHTKTLDLAAVCRSAEILVVAAGKARLVTGDMVSPGTVVVDAGTNSIDGKLVGDVDFQSVSARAAAITPVPGGVGPMTVAMLLQNVVKAAEEE
jgi:methylenetetrahydrofolate dehydrogenase (NADP+)/methenyltetrahydrofolate cyclohydrolase